MSKKGELVPGTNNRIVTISGPLPPPLSALGGRLTLTLSRCAGTPESALYAHQLVQERVAARIATTL